MITTTYAPVIENEAGELTHCGERVYWHDCATHQEACFGFRCVSCNLEVLDCEQEYELKMEEV